MLRLRSIDLTKVAVFDIETAPIVKRYHHLPAALKTAFHKTYKSEIPVLCADDDDVLNAIFIKEAPLSPIFGMIVCISVLQDGFMKSFFQTEVKKEQDVLREFAAYIKAGKPQYFSGHFIKEFDIPRVVQRSMFLGVPQLVEFDFSTRKPWELNHILDTHELMKCNAYRTKGLTLENCCISFGIQNPKENVDGGSVYELFYNFKYNEIANYCEGDVNSNYALLNKLKGATPEQMRFL